MTQNLPRFPPRPTDTAPLYPADELVKLQSIMDNRRPHPPSPPPAPQRKTTWLGKALALVGVAVVSGFVWWVLQPSERVDEPVAQPQKTAGEFEFTSVPQLPGPVKDSDCAVHATGQTQAFFKATPCLQLTRAFYTAKLPDGRTVYSSVSVVKMRTADEARQLRELTQKDGTGNVKDLVLDKAISVPPLTTLANGGYASEQRDQEVVIVESDSPVRGADALAHNKEMKKVSEDAIRLASSFGD
ncbi:hypothetical protein SAMN05216188_1326 [Lentzea xinjiangensis]|uniref:Uncharacterized protein n=1 Tax=Lentzea xinjiangensis TaxID=402600 RepID=A0A1H9WAZ9_9PSEU|nr:hypothetical protein [Lentzea xinjiangensis]SES31080.1 hypothetical protein SAMN05216188_1326 [Lentzea xinjiangensis]